MGPILWWVLGTQTAWCGRRMHLDQSVQKEDQGAERGNRKGVIMPFGSGGFHRSVDF